jgi:hypothetical protein
MKKPHLPRLQRGQYKRAAIAVCIVLIVILLFYAEILRPNQDAKAYVRQLDTSSQPLQECFEELADTTQLSLYYAPDVTLDSKRGDTATILKQINTCHSELNSFDGQAHQLANLHLAGYTAAYRQAKVYQRQAFDITGQSRDVMNQYAKMANFLSKYYDHVIAFSTYTSELQDNRHYLGSAQLMTMEQQASDLRERAAQIGSMEAPQEFTGTKSDTANMMDTAASGLENIVKGYRFGNDYLVNTGYNEIDQAITTYESHIINLPFQQLTKSYIPQQVSQLPAKVENLLASASE